MTGASSVNWTPMIEYLNIKMGDGTFKKGSLNYPWHSVTWLKKNGSSFIRKTGAKNEIGTGAITIGRSSVP